MAGHCDIRDVQQLVSNYNTIYNLRLPSRLLSHALDLSCNPRHPGVANVHVFMPTVVQLLRQHLGA